MKAPELILRCYLKKRDGQWVAVCIDLCLAAQADTASEARRRLEAQIVDYVEEALTVDRDAMRPGGKAAPCLAHADRHAAPAMRTRRPGSSGRPARPPRLWTRNLKSL